MDLSFARFEQNAEVIVLPADLAVLLVGVAARQAASPTALTQARLERTAPAAPFAPAHGAFSMDVAALLAGTHGNRMATAVNAPFTDCVRRPASPPGYGRYTGKEGPRPKGCKAS